MATIFPLDIYPVNFEFGIITRTLVSTSSLTGSTKTLEIPGARWRLRMSYVDLNQTDSRPLFAYLMNLRGMAGRFLIHDITAPNADVTGSITVQSVQGADQITLTGVTGEFKPGDYITINRGGDAGDIELKMIISKGTGQVYNIQPNLRTPDLSFYNGKTITYKSISTFPRAKFMLSSDDQVYWPSRSKINLSTLDLEAIEVI